MNSKSVALAVGLTAAAVWHAPASAAVQYAFGFSGFDGSEALNLTTSAGNFVIGTRGVQGWFSSTASNTAEGTGYSFQAARRVRVRLRRRAMRGGAPVCGAAASVRSALWPTPLA